MRTRLILIIVAYFICNSSAAQSFKKLYKESFKFLEVNDFENALPLLMRMYELKPNNANTNFSIGNGSDNPTGRAANRRVKIQLVK